MGEFASVQVVLLQFPFSELTRSKLRSALLVADAGRGGWIACQITATPTLPTCHYSGVNEETVIPFRLHADTTDEKVSNSIEPYSGDFQTAYR